MWVGADIVGNIAVMRFSRDATLQDKKKFAKDLIKNNKSVKTVLEKTGKFKGRLRKMKTRHLVGEKTKEVLYRENGCVFRFNIDKTYFSSRLSNERKEIAGKVKKRDKVLVSFAGVGPYPIVIAKLSKASKIYSNEINREANKYAKLNVELNKMKDRVEIIPGDFKKVAPRIKGGVSVRGTLVPHKFDVIVMPRPQLEEIFLKEAFALSKKGTKIFYYQFCRRDGEKEVIDNIKKEAKRSKKKIKILKKKVAGEIGPFRVRVRVDFRVL